MSGKALVKQVFDELYRLDSIGFNTWISSVRELASHYNIELHLEKRTDLFKKECQEILERKLIKDWCDEIKDEVKHPILRTYRIYKTSYEMEPYLYLVKNHKYRLAISKIRASSHKLEIERGRYTRPKTPVENRLCTLCKVVENEMHFLLNCSSNKVERDALFEKIQVIYSNFTNLPPIDNVFTC